MRSMQWLLCYPLVVAFVKSSYVLLRFNNNMMLLFIFLFFFFCLRSPLIPLSCAPGRLELVERSMGVCCQG